MINFNNTVNNNQQPSAAQNKESRGECPKTTTSLVKKRKAAYDSVYRCGGCKETYFGGDMKAPLINRDNPIPCDNTIIAASLCINCAPESESGWLSGTLKYARHSRENRVDHAIRLMRATLYGDEKKPKHVRDYYLEQNDELTRAEKALEIYDRLIHRCSSEPLFSESKQAHELRRHAEWVVKFSEQQRLRSIVEKREKKIRTRINALNFERAESTLSAAKREFEWHDWSKVELELECAIYRHRTSEEITLFKSKITEAIECDDEEALTRTLSAAKQAYPLHRWEEYALFQMNG